MERAMKSQLTRQPARPNSARVSQSRTAPAFADNRPEAIAQSKLVGAVAISPRVVAQRKRIEQFTEAAQLQRQSTLPARNTGLPDTLRSGIELLSGISMGDVEVHYNSSQPAKLNARAYTQGADIHVAPGEQRHLPHEAWHVVQQAQGRVQPSMQRMDAVPVNDDAGLEQEASVMGARAEALGRLTAPSWALQGQTENDISRPHQGATTTARENLTPNFLSSSFATGGRHGQVPQFPSAQVVIQPWRDQNGKFHDGAKPTPVGEWESFEFGPRKEIRWRPKQGSETASKAKEEEQKTKEEAVKKGVAAKQAADKRALKWETMCGDYNTIFLEDPAHILYTQDSISMYFTKGNTIQSLADALGKKELTADKVEPIMVELYQGRLYSYDNRRLWAFKKAKLPVRCRFASKKERESNAFKLTGEGKTIEVRK